MQQSAMLRDECSTFATKTGTKTKTEWERNGNENGNENENGMGTGTKTERERKRKRKREWERNGDGNENENYEGADLIEFMRPDSCFSISTIRFSRSACCSSDTYPMFLAINS